MDKLDYLQSPMTDQKKKIDVVALENMLVALTREIGEGTCFFVLKIVLDRCERCPILQLQNAFPNLFCFLFSYSVSQFFMNSHLSFEHSTS